jgi:O-antigen ligase
VSFAGFALLAMYGVRIIGLTWSTDWKYGLQSLEGESVLVAFPILFILLPPTERIAKASMRAYVAMCCSVMVYAFSNFFLLILSHNADVVTFLADYFAAPSDFSKRILDWNFGHYSFMSMMLIYGGIFLLYYPQHFSKCRVIGFCYLAGVLVFCLITGSRIGALLVMCVSVFVILNAVLGMSCKKIVSTGVVCAIVAAAFLYGFADRYKVHENDFVRYQFAATAIEAIKEKPFFGFGTGGQKEVIQSMDRAVGAGFAQTMYYGTKVNHPHNQFLTEILQFGLIGSLPLLIWIISSITRSIKSDFGALAIFMVVVVLFMLVESPLNSNKGIVPLLITFHILTSLSKKEAFVVEQSKESLLQSA